MDKIVRATEKEREALFRNTSAKIGMNEAIVEKDFWVCYILEYLFHDCEYRDNLVFKGGTSLSKVYHLINRFSEDIDLILDWRVLGYGEDEPWVERSNTKQDIFNKNANVQAEIFLGKKFLPLVKKDLSKKMGMEANLYIEGNDPQTVLFAYPRSFQDDSILQVIRLEIGALAAWTPSEEHSIRPYVAEEYPQLFTNSEFVLPVVSAERTFWEKVTILHREAYRENGKMPSRYSRHYYDLFCMMNSTVKINAFSQLDLLKKVVRFKKNFIVVIGQDMTRQ